MTDAEKAELKEFDEMAARAAEHGGALCFDADQLAAEGQEDVSVGILTGAIREGGIFLSTTWLDDPSASRRVFIRQDDWTRMMLDIAAEAGHA